MNILVYSGRRNICPICESEFKTRQGLSGHCRFRHQGQGYYSNYRAKPEVVPAWAAELAKKIEAMQKDIDNMEYLVALLVAPLHPEEIPAQEARLKGKALKFLLKKEEPKGVNPIS